MEEFFNVLTKNIGVFRIHFLLLKVIQREKWRIARGFYGKVLSLKP
jgi:hypothetical protein